MLSTNHEFSTMKLRDWRQALKTPPSYRIGSSSLRVNPKHMILIVAACIFLLLCLYYSLTSHQAIVQRVSEPQGFYNATYPLSKVLRNGAGLTFRIGVISDLDTNSKEGDQWVSYFKMGYLTWRPERNVISVKWEEPIKLKSTLAQNGRAMELSELIVFNGKLYTVDDRTGIVYEINKNRVIPWVILSDGDGTSSKGFKSEWAAVKDETLFIGGLGKEWTNNKNEILNYDPQWVKTITPYGAVRHIDWRMNYVELQRFLGVSYPGYMIHESVCWSSIHKKWYFLPRRASKEPYNEDVDELMGTNLMLVADEYFTEIKSKTIGDLRPSHGFSSFKFLPGSEDQIIVAIKSEELKGVTASYMMAFRIDGQILMPETKFADIKYEGIEFI